MTRCPDWPHAGVCSYCSGGGCRQCGQTGEVADMRPCSHDEREGSLGTVTVAATILGTDGAGVWERVAAGELLAERDDDSQPWVIFRNPARA